MAAAAALQFIALKVVAEAGACVIIIHYQCLKGRHIPLSLEPVVLVAIVAMVTVVAALFV